jgi:hypothetical protein
MEMHMKKNILMILAILSISAVASAKTYSLTLFQRSLVAGAELQPGEYKMELDGSKVMISNGKKRAEAEVKVETGDQKFGSTTVRYQNGDGNYRVQEIRLGGTKIKLVFD